MHNFKILLQQRPEGMERAKKTLSACILAQIQSWHLHNMK